MRPHAPASVLIALAPFAILITSGARAAVPTPAAGPYPYVIVTGQALAPSFLVLAKWRTRTGTRATVRTIESIRDDYPAAGDDAARVRRFLQDARAAWGTSWVLLGGDTEVVPARLARVVDPIGDRLLPTDLYFACLDGSWDQDGDGVYGEWPEDQVDVVADVFLGRAPVSDPAEAARFVDRTIGYQRTPAPNYQVNTLVMAEVLNSNIDTAPMAEQVLPMIQDDPLQHLARLYEDAAHPNWPPPVYPESRASVRDSLSEGYHFVLGMGGGGPTLFSVGDEQQPGSDPYLTVPDVLGLTNAPRFSHVYLLTSLVNRITEPVSLGEAFLKAAQGGAVTVTAPTDLAFLSSLNQIMREFVRLVFDAGAATVGEAFVAQMAPLQPGPNLTDRGLMYAELLLGDPRLPVYTAPPAALAVTHAVSVAAGPALLEVAVRSGDAALPGAEVIACVGDRPATALTNAQGVARVPIDAPAGATVDVTVLARNARPYESTVAVAGTAVGVDGAPVARLDLAQRGAHPVRERAQLALGIPPALAGADLELAVFDPAGRRVRTLARGPAREGMRTVAWDLRDQRGDAVRNGLYLIAATAGGQRVSRTVVVLR